MTASIRALLSRDHRRSCAAVKFQSLCSGEIGLDALADACAQVMENPVGLLNNTFELISHTDAWCYEESLRALSKFAASQQIDQALYTQVDANSTEHQLLSPIRHKSQIIGYLLVVSPGCPFEDTVDLAYAEYLCDVLSSQAQFERLFSGNADEAFILSLLQGTLTDSDLIEKKIEELQRRRSEKYCVLTIETKQTNNTLDDGLFWKIKSALPFPVYCYQQYYVAVIGYEKDASLSKEMLQDLNKLLSDEDLYAGLSYDFIDFSLLRIYFQQSTATIRLIKLSRRFSRTVHFAKYEDFAEVHLLEIAENAGVPILFFCHPTIREIHEYDTQHGTEYLKTLTAYIMKNLSLSESANSLHIHRNTMYYRVNQLRSLFGIDFESYRLIFKLRFSIAAYNYLGYVDSYPHLGPFY